ncbi:MAG TPA: biliverdin-producing heme oxygenase [Gemmatimonadaceae bacterium]|jgi:heme oxygenase
MTSPQRIDERQHDLPNDHSSLSRRLRAETKELHTAAERSGIMRRLTRGQISRVQYVALLENLAEIYRALEDELRRHRTEPTLSWIDLAALARFDHLQHDITRLRRPGDPAPSIRPTTHIYVERVTTAGETEPPLLLAHAYVRYLGDLSGGQILAPIVARALGDDADDALTFYAFPQIDDAAAFKGEFRGGLDSIADDTVRDRIVDEAKVGFRLHEELFRELEQD